MENFDKDKIELYVNGIKMEFQDYIYAIKKGTYDIKLIFKMDIKNCFEMFRMCHNIIEINLSCFDTSKVTNMGYMFSNNDKLKKINLENIDTKNVTDMESMFRECFKLKKLNVSSFNTKKVKKMESMFAYTGLKYLDLSSFDFIENCTITNIIGGSPLKLIKMKKNNDIEKELFNYIKHYNGKIISV